MDLSPTAVLYFRLKFSVLYFILISLFVSVIRKKKENRYSVVKERGADLSIPDPPAKRGDDPKIFLHTALSDLPLEISVLPPFSTGFLARSFHGIIPSHTMGRFTMKKKRVKRTAKAIKTKNGEGKYARLRALLLSEKKTFAAEEMMQVSGFDERNLKTTLMILKNPKRTKDLIITRFDAENIFCLVSAFAENCKITENIP